MISKKNKKTSIKLSSWKIIWFIIPFIAIPAYCLSAVENTPEIWIKEWVVVNNITGELYIEACNNRDRSISWDKPFWFSSKLIFHEKISWKEIKINIKYPQQSTIPNPWCSTITWIMPPDFYWELTVIPECRNEDYLTWCWSSENREIKITRKKQDIIIVDASAQSYENAGSWEKYDFIEPHILEKFLDNFWVKTIVTWAPWRASNSRDGLYKNRQKRPIICWNLTNEEKIFYTKEIHGSIPQYINEPLFCTRDELLNPQNPDLKAFLYYIWDCDESTEYRWRICNYWKIDIDSNLQWIMNPLYSRRIFENSKNSVLIFLPAVTDEIKIKE